MPSTNAATAELNRAIEECNDIMRRWDGAKIDQNRKVDAAGEYFNKSACACFPFCCISMLAAWTCGGMSSRQRVYYKKYKELRRYALKEFPHIDKQFKEEYDRAYDRVREAEYRARYAAAASSASASSS